MLQNTYKIQSCNRQVDNIISFQLFSNKLCQPEGSYTHALQDAFSVNFVLNSHVNADQLLKSSWYLARGI